MHDPETGRPEWRCNGPRPMRTNAEHESAWALLSEEEVNRLTAEMSRRGDA